MNNIDTQPAARTPVVYIANIEGDPDGAAKAWLKSCICAFSPYAVSAPAGILVDNADYGRLDTESLNAFLVDADIDAVVWASAPDAGGERQFHCAVANYSKVQFAGREAEVFTLRTANTGRAETGSLLAANILGAASSEIAAIRPAAMPLIDTCIQAMEGALDGPMERDLYLNTLERLQALYAVVRDDARREQHLRRAIALNECLCCELDGADSARLARLLTQRANCLAAVGTQTDELKDILGAITVLKQAAPHIRDDAGRARLDVMLAHCKTALGAILGDAEILASARDLLRAIIPVLYRQLAVESWAAAQANLSWASWRLYRATGTFAYAVEALDAAHEALTVYNAKSLPFDWARTNSNLGVMLCTLGDDPENIDTLYCGIECLRDALSFYTADRYPLDHAAAAVHLAEALSALAHHTNDPAHLISAESSLLGARRIYRRKGDPKAAEIEVHLAAVRRKTLLPQ